MTNKTVTGDLKPLSASASECNGYLVDCSEVTFKPGYSVCLNRIDKSNKGEGKFFPPCAIAIRGRTCPAIKMRQDEEAVGHALYFIPRTPKRDTFADPLYAPLMPSTRSSQAAVPQKAAPAPVRSVTPPEDLYAAAIEAAMKPTATPAPVPLKGLNPRQLALLKLKGASA